MNPRIRTKHLHRFLGGIALATLLVACGASNSSDISRVPTDDTDVPVTSGDSAVDVVNEDLATLDADLQVIDEALAEIDALDTIAPNP
jgi:hypothetical protein